MNSLPLAELFALEDEGFAFRLSGLAESFLDTDGLIDTREDGLRARIESNETAQFNLEYRLERKEASLRKQFATLDSLLGSMQSMSNYLSSALNA